MIRDRLEQIRQRAYALWEKAGGGHGRDQEHWHSAVREVDAEDDVAAAKRPRGRPAKAARTIDEPKKPVAPAKTRKGVPSNVPGQPVATENATAKRKGQPLTDTASSTNIARSKVPSKNVKASVGSASTDAPDSSVPSSGRRAPLKKATKKSVERTKKG